MKIIGFMISMHKPKICQAFYLQVSLIDMESPSLLYQKLIESELSTGVISVWFESCILHGFEKNILAVATKDSSILALDSDTGNTLSTSMIHPKKPSKALFMQILGNHSFCLPKIFMLTLRRINK